VQEVDASNNVKIQLMSSAVTIFAQTMKTVAARFQGVIKQKNAILKVAIASPGRIANQSMISFSASPIARLKTVSARL